MFTMYLSLVRNSQLLQTYNWFPGGISVISHRHAVANNPLLRDFDSAVPESYLLYIDANVSCYKFSLITLLASFESRLICNLA